MSRALLIVLDSVGIGGAPDAAAFGDDGADTIGHIAEACAAGAADPSGLRSGPLRLPHLGRLGLGEACRLSTGRVPPGLETPGAPAGLWGVGRERAGGKDTVSGHWEMAGLDLARPFGLFPDAEPAFPPALTDALVREAALPGILGNRHASGDAIVRTLGAKSVRTGRPICYTSVDSVFQIAAHEEAFGLARLYETCLIARRLCDPYRIGRVIARPFVGDEAAGFRRSTGRRDFAVPPPGTTLLDRLAEAGRAVATIGKVSDIFAGRGTGTVVKAAGNAACLDAALAALGTLPPGGLVFANLVDFDTEYGHRRNVAGYAAALEAFDRRVPEIEAALRPGDLCLVTADHGNDPTFRGTDHTREQVPILGFGPGIAPRPVGIRDGFADLGATIARHLGIGLDRGTPF